jgi:hypothetical protein
MFPSETLSRLLHAERVRDLERAAETHRLLAVDPETTVAAEPVAPLTRQASAPCPPAPRGGSAGVVA